MLGAALARTGRPQEAAGHLAQFDQALALKPALEEAASNRQITLERQKPVIQRTNTIPGWPL